MQTDIQGEGGPVPTANPVAVLIADDHAFLREGMRALLEDSMRFRVVAEAKDGKEAVDLYGEHRPDLVIMDLGMKPMDGVEATRHIKAMDPTSRVLALTAHNTEEYLYPALRAGLDGYIYKAVAFEELLLAIDSVLAGKKYVSPEVTESLIRSYVRFGGTDLDDPRLDGLTEREREVFRLVIEDTGSAEIARRLHISPATVDKHKQNLKHKLGLSSASEIKRFGLDS